jgi:hypothetical protein
VGRIIRITREGEVEVNHFGTHQRNEREEGGQFADSVTEIVLKEKDAKTFIF